MRELNGFIFNGLCYPIQAENVFDSVYVHSFNVLVCEHYQFHYFGSDRRNVSNNRTRGLKRNGIAYAKTNMSGYQKVVFLFIIACLQGLQYLLAASSNPKTFTEQLLGIREPLELEFCKKLGYSYTAKINFLKENQREAENNKNFKALLRLSKTRCSPLVRHFACSLFAPQLLPKYGVVPPCKSLCLSLTKSCALYLRWASMFTAYSGKQFFYK